MKSQLGKWILLSILCLFTGVAMYGREQQDALDSLYQRAKSEGYRIEVNRVRSGSVPNTERFNPSGFMEVNDSTAKGELPFFGRAYQVPYGDRTGITFDGATEKLRVEKKKKRVEVRFDVRNNSENYQFVIQLYPGGNASINMISNQREGSNYDGTYQFFNDKP